MKLLRSKYKWLFIPLLALLCFGLTLIASHHPSLTEEIYSEGLYPFIAGILSPVSSLIFFSLDDLFYVFLILSVPALIVLLILRKISFRTAGKRILNVLAAVYILFYVLWGFNYFREDLNTRLQLKNSKIGKDMFQDFLTALILKTNQSYCTIQLSGEETDSLVEASYKRLSDALKLSYPGGVRKDKSITFSRFFAQSGITGYFGPFFNEVHVNKKVLPIEYPIVLAHEKAHQFGITSEGEANFYAWLVCSNSESQEIRYAANLYILRHFLNQAYSLRNYPEFVKMIDPGVKNDFNTLGEYWQKLRNEKMDRVASKVNDAYLKTNKVEKGIMDYSGVVKHVLNFSQDTAFQNQIPPASGN